MNPNPIDAADMERIVQYYTGGVALHIIAAAVDRSIGTIKSATFRLRAAGIIGRRYVADPDV